MFKAPFYRPSPLENRCPTEFESSFVDVCSRTFLELSMKPLLKELLVELFVGRVQHVHQTPCVENEWPGRYFQYWNT